MTKKLIFTCGMAMILMLSCSTVHFDSPDPVSGEYVPGIDTYEQELKQNEKEREELFIEEELKEVDVEKTIIYIDRPVYSPSEKPSAPPLEGAAAVRDSAKKSIQIPLKYVNGIMFYPWDETFTYEIYCQPFRTTDIQLEPGEQVLEMPFLSEEKVWELGAGVSRKNGVDVQHFFLKPTYANLVSSMIIITDRRVYHLLLKSFSTQFMVMVQWEYPRSMPFTVNTDAINRRKAELNNDALLVNPEFLSFDYRMTCNIFKKPLWIPRRVYDDGRKTYIELDEKMLHSEAPVIFNHRNERINYRVQKNLVVIDELVRKITIRRGREKVTVEKKRYREKPAENDTEKKEAGQNENGKERTK
jgi:type IV secretion system protein VirB9